MNKFLIGALALTVTGGTGFASESDWAGLDAELDSLSTSLATQSVGPNLSGWIISSLRFSGDVQPPGALAADGSQNDLGGFNLDSVRLNVDGSVGEYSYMLSTDFGSSDGGGSGTAAILDAFVDWMVGETVHLKMGNFRQPFLRSSLISRNRTLFIDRTAMGALFAGRQTGVQVYGDFEQVRWRVAAQNGFIDGIGDDFLITGRVDVDVIGNGVGDQEGAYGASEEAALTVGAAVADEGAHDDGLHWAIDAAFTSGPFSAQAEIVGFDDGTNIGGNDQFLLGYPVIDGLGLGNDLSDSTPWSVTASYAFPDNDYEVAARYQDADNDADESLLSLGVNKYVKGHDIKWQLGWSMFDSDVSEDGDIFSLGLALGF